MRRSLNEDLDSLYQLKDLWHRAVDLRDRAYGALNGIASIEPPSEKDGQSSHVVISPRDPNDKKRYREWIAMGNRLEAALLIKVQSERFYPASRTSAGHDIDPALFERVEGIDLPTLFPPPETPTATESQSNAVLDRRVPVLLAALALQVLASRSSTALSKTAMICYYRVLVELAVAVRPDWTIGAARAGDAGNISAFVTNECIRAILTLERAFSKTVDFFDRTVDLCEQYTVLEAMVAATDGRPTHPVNLWIEKAAQRMWVDWYISTEAYRRQIAFNLKDDPPPFVDRKEIGEYLTAFRTNLHEAIRDARRTTAAALEAIEKFLKNDQAAAGDAGADDPVPAVPAEKRKTRLLPHEVVKKAVHEATIAEETCRDFHDLPLRLKELRKQFLEVRRNIHRVLDPSRRYVEAVLDRELSAPDNSHLDAGELVFAAASYGALSEWKHDRSHLSRACERALGAIPAGGTLSTKRPFHSTRRGYKLFPTGCEMIRNLAQVLDRTGYEFGPEPIRMLLEFIQDKSIERGAGRDVGWNFEGATDFESPSVWVTAVTVLALDRVVRLLDARINAIALSHFDVIHPKKPHADLTLNELIYPDYGFTAYYDGRAPGAPSIAMRLEQMRAHLTRVVLPPLPGERSSEVFAAVLYGPPQTGKTTLAEALALSSNVPLIRLSPFDLSPVESHQSVPGRTRMVFETISMLTQVVILLDEFESVLLKRHDAKTEASAETSQAPSSASQTEHLLLTGLLPQLVKLHDVARRQSVVYCMATNFLDKVDDAAIRRGRFDHWLPVYNPDPLSRAATFLYRLYRLKLSEDRDWRLDSDAAMRLLKVVVENPAVPASTLAEAVINLPKWFLRQRVTFRGDRAVRAGIAFEVVDGTATDVDQPRVSIDYTDEDRERLSQKPTGAAKPLLEDELRERAWLRAVEEDLMQSYENELSREEKRAVARLLYDCLYPKHTLERTSGARPRA